MGELYELRELTRVRILLFLREKEALFWALVFPLLMAAVLGYAFRSGETQPSRVTVLSGPGSAELMLRLEASEHLEVDRAESPAEARQRLQRGKVDALVVAGEPPEIRFDPQRPEAETARLRVHLALAPERAELTEHTFQEVGGRYIDFLFPGLLGLNLMGTGLWTIGFAIADIRQRKVLKRLLVTPMRRSNFFLSFIVSRLVFLFVEVAILATFGVLALDVPLRGSIAAFAFLTVLGAFTFAGLGLLTASRATTIEGVSGILNAVMMPMWLGSGVFFSYERFPALVQPALRLLPLTALNDALRAVMLDGEGLPSLGFELGVLLVWCVAPFAVALRVFRWE